MPKKTISSLELAALINELQFLIKGKISQIYHQGNNELIFQIHAPSQGKQMLKIIPGKLIFLTGTKNAPLHPSGFCMQLRKYLANAVIRDLYQKDSERVVVFELEKKDKFFMIIELFSTGNLILSDNNFKIITALEQQTWKDRIIKPGEKYLFPKSKINWKNITENKLSSIIKKSEKKNLATSLATEIGLGGIYAEELCKRTGIDHNLLTKEVSQKQIKVMIKELKNLTKLIGIPQGFIYQEQVTPFPLTDEKPLKKTKTYNEAISTLDPFNPVSPYEAKINLLEKIIARQKKSILELERNIELNKRKGELIYEKYAPLQKLLQIVTELRKNKDWKEISLELKKEKKIKNIDLKNKKILIDL